MELLERLDKALGPGVMDKPIFSIADEGHPVASEADSPALGDVSTGRYDALFAGAPDKPSDLYRAAQIRPPTPTVRVVNASPVKPEESAPPHYPPLAKAARIEGTVTFKVDVATDGRASNFALVSGHPMLVPTVTDAVSRWRFSKEAAGRQIDASVEFATNCPKQK